MNPLTVCLALLCAAAGGLTAQHLNVPGGLIMGALVGAAAVGLVANTGAELPRPFIGAAQIALGAGIGLQVTRKNVTELGAMVLPGILSGALIIGAGLGIAYLLRVLHIAPDGDVLATSPGALNVLSGIALEQGVGAVQVAFFHLIRIVMVILSLPLLIHLLPDQR
jgi:membrane AbrB-like protein